LVLSSNRAVVAQNEQHDVLSLSFPEQNLVVSKQSEVVRKRLNRHGC
jgi:hypothetical protein